MLVPCQGIPLALWREWPVEGAGHRLARGRTPGPKARTLAESRLTAAVRDWLPGWTALGTGDRKTGHSQLGPRLPGQSDGEESRGGRTIERMLAEVRSAG